MPTRLSLSLRSVVAQRFFRLAAGISAAMFVLGIVLMLWQIPRPSADPASGQTGVVPLHYNIYFGVDEVGQWWQLFIPSLIVLGMSVLNTLAAAHWWSREQVFSYAFGVLTVALHALLFLHIILIVLLNLSYA